MNRKEKSAPRHVWDTKNVALRQSETRITSNGENLKERSVRNYFWWKLLSVVKQEILSIERIYKVCGCEWGDCRKKNYPTFPLDKRLLQWMAELPWTRSQQRPDPLNPGCPQYPWPLCKSLLPASQKHQGRNNSRKQVKARMLCRKKKSFNSLLKFSCLKWNERGGRNVLKCPVVAVFKSYEINLKNTGLFFSDNLLEKIKCFHHKHLCCPFLKCYHGLQIKYSL